ncbi:MAG: hypothetical protein ACF8NJ_11000, partial [Phycisphaerales bacterium JB038]
TVGIPMGATATVRIPTDDVGSVREGGEPLSVPGGLGHARAVQGGVEVEVASGTYTFTASYASAS